jgi:cytochrome oxidase assembly protein ShyY1
LVRDWALPTLGIERHRAYALQWFSMAAVILILYVVLNVRRKAPPA